MNRAITLVVTILAVLTAWGQNVPQFTSTDFEGWTYNKPGVELNNSNIANGKVVFFMYQDTLPLTLISPEFPCSGIDSIAATVTWYTEAYNNSRFDLSKASLTLVIEDADGVLQDSVTCVPTTPGTSSHKLVFKVAVPRGLATGRMRFVSWTGDVLSCGAIKKTKIEATASGGDEVLRGDVDGNGTIDPADISALINYLLNGSPVNEANADMNNDGSIDPSDISTLINFLLNS